MKNIFVRMTLACLVLALMIAMVSAQYDYDSAKTPNSAVTVATDIFISLAIAAVALLASFIYRVHFCCLCFSFFWLFSLCRKSLMWLYLMNLLLFWTFNEKQTCQVVYWQLDVIFFKIHEPGFESKHIKRYKHNNTWNKNVTNSTNTQYSSWRSLKPQQNFPGLKIPTQPTWPLGVGSLFWISEDPRAEFFYNSTAKLSFCVSCFWYGNEGRFCSPVRS